MVEENGVVKYKTSYERPTISILDYILIKSITI